MPIAIICVPDHIWPKCAADFQALKKKVPGMKFEVTHKPIDACTSAREMGAKEADGRAHLAIVHSKLFNITKDPFAATMFKSLQGSKTAIFGCGKESGCDKPGKKFHWFLGEDGAWDMTNAVKHINNILDGKFNENGFFGPPIRKRGASLDAGSSGARPQATNMGMQPGMNMGMGTSMGQMGGMQTGMGNMSGTNGMMSTMGNMGTMGSVQQQYSPSQLGSPTFNSGMNGTANGSMIGAGGGMFHGMNPGMSGGLNMGMTGGLNGSMGGAPDGLSGSMASGINGMNTGMSAMNNGAGALMSSRSMHSPVNQDGMTSKAATSTGMDILTQVEGMVQRGVPTNEVVKLLAGEVQRLANVVEGR